MTEKRDVVVIGAYLLTEIGGADLCKAATENSNFFRRASLHIGQKCTIDFPREDVARRGRSKMQYTRQLYHRNSKRN